MNGVVQQPKIDLNKG